MSQPRTLHTMLRVKNLEKSVEFYTTKMGMHELRRTEVPDGKYTLVFVGFAPDDEQAAVELTFNWDQTDGYEVGNGFGHLAFGLPDIYAACDKMRAAGVQITREPGPVKFGTTEIAFVKDPDGYVIELIQRK